MLSCSVPSPAPRPKCMHRDSRAMEEGRLTGGDDVEEAGELRASQGEGLPDALGRPAHNTGVWRKRHADAAAAVRRKGRRHRDVHDAGAARHCEVQLLFRVISVVADTPISHILAVCVDYTVPAHTALKIKGFRKWIDISFVQLACQVPLRRIICCKEAT